MFSSGGQYPILTPQQMGGGILQDALRKYQEMTKAQYATRHHEADILSKQLGPLAQIAISPIAEGLDSKQREQIMNYISQMIQNQGQGQGIPGGQAQGGGGIMDKIASMFHGGQQGNASAQGQATNMPQPQQSGPEGGLVPHGLGGKITQPFTESGYTGGKAHRDAEGNIIQTPGSGVVSQGENALLQTKGLKKTFDEYSKLASQFAGTGKIKTNISEIAGGIEKLGPLGKIASQFMGGRGPAEAKAKMISLKAQMQPGLQSIGLNPHLIDSIFSVHPGESEEAVAARLKQAWPFIEGRIKNYNKALASGIEVNPEAQGNMQKNVTENVGQVSKDIQHTAKLFNTTPEIVMEAQKVGIKNAAEFRDWIANRNR
jgi:hypothetical protein